jgi:hypothetical protein
MKLSSSYILSLAGYDQLTTVFFVRSLLVDLALWD